MIWSDTIDISWSDRKLEKACFSDKDGTRRFGLEQWKVIKRRIASLIAAPTLADMAGVPGRCHQLSADRDEQFALDLRGADRLVFEVNNVPTPRLADGGIDRPLVTKVLITEVADYHAR